MNDMYQVRLNESNQDTDWDQFVAMTAGGHHTQTCRWGQIKTVLGWRAIRVVARSHDLIVAGAQLLIRPFPVLGAVGYVTKGPLSSVEDHQLTEWIICKIQQIAKKYHAQFLAIQPPSSGQAIAEQLSRLGYQHSSLEVAPTASLILDLRPDFDQMLCRMKRHTRQNIRRSQREGISTRLGTAQDLDRFYQLHLATSRRQGFVPYSKKYFQRMWEVFAPNGNIQLILAERDGSPISALLIIAFGDTVTAKALGWSGCHPELRPNEAIFWASIQWAKTHGYKKFDFEGIDASGARALLRGEPLPESLRCKPDFFKLGFGGQVILYPEAYELVFNPVFRWAYRKASPEVGGRSFPSRIFDYLRKI